jgi:hypothetical protein
MKLMLGMLAAVFVVGGLVAGYLWWNAPPTVVAQGRVRVTVQDGQTGDGQTPVRYQSGSATGTLPVGDALGTSLEVSRDQRPDGVPAGTQLDCAFEQQRKPVSGRRQVVLTDCHLPD